MWNLAAARRIWSGMDGLRLAMERRAREGGAWALTPDHAGLIERARSEPAAFGELYRAHYVAIAGYILRRVGDAHLAEDLAAETFLDAWRGMGRYRHGPVPFRHWLLRIATNRVNRWARRHGRRREIGLVSELDAASPPDRPALEDIRAVMAALSRLSMRHQSVLCLHHVEGLSVEQAALVLGCSPGTVKSRLHRAREAMRRELDRPEVKP
ncbi:MAG TPA: RNA polymerase sigma factor [Phycisphaerales bacterium]|nr:RNA polymerase sigma factor [Phycisphaerales bacterium]